MKKDERVKVTRLMKPNKSNRSADSLNRTTGTDNIKDYDRAWEDDRL
ncbi:hypothetical protein P9D43_16625 [Neobacillus niacini]|nr:hypothetical protein [Neobacillus niacini]MEC1523631.1 hypothetical protein [Neobacillus niacini]